MTVTLDGTEMTDRCAAHEYLKKQLDLPDYYGGNLDALYDILTEYEKECTIILRNRVAMEDNLGSYSLSLIDTIKDAARDNPALELIFSSK